MSTKRKAKGHKLRSAKLPSRLGWCREAQTIFDQIFGQVFDQIFGQGFDQDLGEGKKHK